LIIQSPSILNDTFTGLELLFNTSNDYSVPQGKIIEKIHQVAAGVCVQFNPQQQPANFTSPVVVSGSGENFVMSVQHLTNLSMDAAGDYRLVDMQQGFYANGSSTVRRLWLA
jgi:hypothetical protein